MRRNHPGALLRRALSGAQRPTRLLIGLPAGLSSAIFAKGTTGAPRVFTVRAEAPPLPGFEVFLRARTRGSGERAGPAGGPSREGGGEGGRRGKEGHVVLGTVS